MITGKIILKSATKLSLDKRFSEIAKQAPPAAPRIQQTANVIIPRSKQELFGARRPATLSIAQRLKKRSINYRLGLNANAVASRPRVAAVKPRVFQRLSFANRRRGRGGSGLGANAYLFGGQSGMGIRLRGQGRIGGTRPTRPRTRGFLNNGAISRYSNNSTRGNRSNTRGRRGGANNNNNNNSNNGAGGNFNRFKRGRGGPNASRGRGRNNNNNSQTVSKESLDTDLDKYMSQTKLDNDSVDMNAV